CVIRFSAFLVVAAVGTLVAGVVTSKLLLVYIAIGVSGLALLALGAGAAVHWRELTGKPETAAARVGAQATSAPPAVVRTQVTTPEPAAAPVASAAAGTAASRPAWSGTVPVGSSRPDYPAPATRPPAPSEWKWRDDPASREAAAEKPAASLAGQRDSAVAGDRPSAHDEDLSLQDQTLIFRQPDQTMIFRAQPSASRPAASTAEPEPSPAAATTAAEDTAPPPGDGDAERAADTSAPPRTAPAGGTASEGSTSSEAGTAPEDEPEPADDATTVTKAADPASGADPASHLEVTVVPGVPRYHKATCILIRFMGDSDLDKTTVAAAKDAGCTPCRACLPDQPEGSPE
ncbi:MAG TPA: hypothetical protein VFQ68_09860, partial [Streptosporangiaceae bacterium]|nr:hypothetical protein [Streptosporangiaceae bacterium]